MSDTQQGPGWWRAGDGKWYPPNAGQVPPVSRPMPDPQQQGGRSNSTLLAIVGGIGAVLIGLVVLGVLASAGDGDDDPTAADSVDEREADEPATAPLSALSDEEREERADVELTDCGPGQFNDMLATLEVTNHSSEPSLYFIDVVFENPGGSRQLGTSFATVDDLGPDQVTTVEAPSLDLGPAWAGRFECRIADVQRFAS